MTRHTLLLFLLCISTVCLSQHQGMIDLPLTSWKFSEAGKQDWKPATVPGNIHLDLLNNKLIADPTYGENFKKCEWVEKKDWEYTTSLPMDTIHKEELAGANAELVFESLDTYADIFLDDSLVLQTDNMFRSYSLRIEKLLKPGANQLRILFHSAPDYIRPQCAAAGIRYPADNDSTAPFTRKSPVQYGWDFAPRMITCGIRKRVHLRYWHDFIIRDVHVIRNTLSATQALMTAEITIASSVTDSVHLSLETYGSGKTVLLLPGYNIFRLPFRMAHPKLWWPAGMGEPYLYELQAQAWNTGNKSSHRVSFGLRTVELINQPDSTGQPFYFRVNGEPLYIRGANLVPPPLLQKKADFDNTIQSLMSDCQLNLVRIWGGGIYGDDDFYMYADQNGILVWQDFMFSGTMYPGDSVFLKNVKAEAEDNIIRLRNHPSLALWCGNNEIEVAWKNWGWQKTFHYSSPDSLKLLVAYNSLFKELLPNTLAALDSSRPYFSSSPQSNWGKADDFTKGDNHYWGVWHGEEPFSSYNTHVGRFMSEFGFPSFPSLSSIRHFDGEQNPEINSAVMKAHQFSYKGNALIGKYMDLYYRKPKDFESFVYVSQLLQGEGMKTAIEAQRLKKPFCMGSVFWQLNDYWPSVSWSAIDYYGEQKAAFFFIRQAFDPSILSAHVENGQLKIYIATEGNKPHQTELVLQLCDLHGEHKTEIRKPVKWKGNTPEKVFSQLLQSGNPEKNTKSAGLLDGYDKTDCVLSCRIQTGKDSVVSAVVYFTEPKNLQLTQPLIHSEIKKEDDHYILKLKSDVLAKNVFISTAESNAINPADNYFDLLPGIEKSILIYSDLSEEKLNKAVVIRSLWDTYNK
ncbi:MAG TPA: glycoside hydrolase family 2 protein [Bacteroidia bacterium]|jgi:beta-mannosidase|nr:glycoside hydrolase family 2 protein [Bacteroidia bacterium]